MHVQSCRFALSSLIAYLIFSSLPQLKLPIIYNTLIVVRQKQNILGANSVVPVDSIPNIFSTHQ